MKETLQDFLNRVERNVENVNRTRSPSCAEDAALQDLAIAFQHINNLVATLEKIRAAVNAPW